MLWLVRIRIIIIGCDIFQNFQMCQSIQKCQKVFVNYLIMEWEAQHGTNGSLQIDAGPTKVPANEGARLASSDQSETFSHPWPTQGCHSASFRQRVSFKASVVTHFEKPLTKSCLNLTILLTSDLIMSDLETNAESFSAGKHGYKIENPLRHNDENC